MSNLPNIILPATTADLYQNNGAAALPQPPGQNGEAFDYVMNRALSSKPTADNTAPESHATQEKNLKYPSQNTFGSTTGTAARANVNWVPAGTTRPEAALATNAAKAMVNAKANPGSTAKTFTPSGPPANQPVKNASSTLTAGAQKVSVTSQNISPAQTPLEKLTANKNTTSSATTPPAISAKALAESDTNTKNAVSSHTNASNNPAPQPEINNSVVNPGNSPAQMMTSIAAVEGLTLPLPVNAPTAATSKPASTATVSAGNKTPPTTTMSNTAPAVSTKPILPTAVSPVATGSRRETGTFAGMKPEARNAEADSESSVSAPLTGQISPAPLKTGEDSSDSKPVTLLATDSAPTGLAPVNVSEAKTDPPALAIADGTSTAQQDLLMSNAGKPIKTADLTGKFLPGSVAVVATGADLSARADQVSASITAAASNQGNAGTTATGSGADSTESFSSSGVASQTLERMHDLVAVHATNLGATTDSASLQVVIKPGAGTQISLDLRQHADGVVAQASLQQGDYKHLNQHWPDLQQRLEQRGIRLSPLTDEGSFTQSSGGGSSHQKQNQSGDQLAEVTVAAPVMGTFKPTGSRQTAPTGWQTWA